MTWQEKRIITILSIILAILSAALLIVLGIRYRATRDLKAEDPAAPVFSDSPAAESVFTALTYNNGSTTLSFSLNEEGAWVWSDDTEFPLDDSTVQEILTILSNWDPQQTLKDPDAISGSGTDEPRATLAATTPTGSVTISFGRKTTEETSDYVRLNEDESTVYIIDGGLYELMCIPIFDMCIIPPLPQLSEESIHSIIIRGTAAEDGTPGLSTGLTAQRAEGDTATTWRSGGANVTDDPTVRDLLSDLSALAFDKCILYRPSEEAASICGFDNPAKLLVYYTEKESDSAMLELQIGTPLPDGSGRYARFGDDTSIYRLSTAALDPLMRISANGLE